MKRYSGRLVKSESGRGNTRLRLKMDRINQRAAPALGVGWPFGRVVHILPCLPAAAADLVRHADRRSRSRNHNIMTRFITLLALASLLLFSGCASTDVVKFDEIKRPP